MRALARHDKGRCAWRLGAFAEISPCGDDDEHERDHGEEIHLSWVMAVAADFPAHCCSSQRSNQTIQRQRLEFHVPPLCLQCVFDLKAPQWNLPRLHFQGALTPRHRAYRHGRYHRAPGGAVFGTLSMPEVPKG
jgi:hypothetical protein